MSFDALTADYAPKKEAVVISHGGKDYTFHAVEISYLAQQNIAFSRSRGDDWLADMVAASIVDENGKHMSRDQALKLSKEHAEKFLEAALRINKEEQEKN